MAWTDSIAKAIEVKLTQKLNRGSNQKIGLYIYTSFLTRAMHG
jgi:hypothetical protein